MASYVPWHGKKRWILASRESDLLRLLQRGGSDARVRQAADEVKAARIRVLKVERSRIPQSGLHDARLEEIDRRICECLSVPVEAIILEFRSRAEKMRNR
jgi:hypothetical protein